MKYILPVILLLGLFSCRHAGGATNPLCHTFIIDKELKVIWIGSPCCEYNIRRTIQRNDENITRKQVIHL